MGAFTGPVQLDFGDWGANVGRIAITLAPITWRGITLPAGFMSDGATVPRLLWWFLPPWGDRATVAALFHDFVCERLQAGTPMAGCETRALCDALFYDCLIAAGVEPWRAWLVWLGARVFSIVSRL